MTIALPPWLGFAVAVLICGCAAWKGGAEERLAAGGFMASLMVTVLMRDNTWPAVQHAIFVADTALLLLLIGIALRTPKYWPLAAAGFQLLAFMTHVAKSIDAGLKQWAYMTAGVIWTYLLLGALGVGVWNSWQTRRQLQRAEREIDRRM